MIENISKQSITNLINKNEFAFLNSDKIAYNFFVNNYDAKDEKYLNYFNLCKVFYKRHDNIGEKVLNHSNIYSMHFIRNNKNFNVIEHTEEFFILLKNIFSEKILAEYDIKSIEDLTEKLKYFKTSFINETTTEISEVNFFRVEEEKEDERLIVSVDPPTGVVRFSLTRPSNEGIQTAILKYFYDVYDWKGFNRESKYDDLTFMEEESFPKYPKHFNNLQIFEINFGYLINSDPTTILNRSFYRQRKFVKQFLNVCNIYCEQDAFGNKELNNKTELSNIEIESNKQIKYANANRIYCTPEFKMIVITKPTMIDDTPYASKLVIYQPLFKETISATKWLNHPIVYDARK